jgi:1-acyl-sn-glycerol-3-phosphate acyltransferase
MTLYGFAKGIFLFIFNFFSRWKVTGRDNLPREGPVVVVCNHISLWDPVAVGVALDRQVFFMAKEELFQYPIFGRLLRRLGAFPVKRGQSDRAAIKSSLEVLKKGNVLGLFPEGHRNDQEKLGDFQEGAVFLAVKCKAALLPVGVIGTKGMYRKLRFHSFGVNIGKPIFTDNPQNLPQADYVRLLNEQIREEVGRLSCLDLS